MVRLKLCNYSLIIISFIVISQFAFGATVPKLYRKVANQYQIDSCLLNSMALTESGVKLRSGLVRPWPWTINIKGKGYFFNTRIEAVNFVVRNLPKTRSIDIGLLQINWRWHHHRFTSVWSAFDPEINMINAAKIFREGLTRTGNVWDAVGYYHSPSNPTNAEAYIKRVKKRWLKLCKS